MTSRDRGLARLAVILIEGALDENEDAVKDKNFLALSFLTQPPPKNTGTGATSVAPMTMTELARF